MNKDFGKRFDRDFERMQRGFWAIWIVTVVLILGLISFGIWVIIMLLRFFGVI